LKIQDLNNIGLETCVCTEITSAIALVHFKNISYKSVDKFNITYRFVSYEKIHIIYRKIHR